MAAPHSQDLRDRVLASSGRGMNTRQIAATFAVSPAWARRVKQVRRESGRTMPSHMVGHRFQRIDLAELRRPLGVVRSMSTVDAALKKL